jgi:F-box/leucine-rich repeat protein 14
VSQLQHVDFGLLNAQCQRLKYADNCVGLAVSTFLIRDNISDTGIGYLSNGSAKISSLDVSFCDKIGDQSLQYIAQGLFCLRCLSLNACNISDDGIYRLVRTLHELTTLNKYIILYNEL